MCLQFPQASQKLTPTEQRLLEFIEGNREEFLFMTIGQLSQRLEISEATISRFARHLGCQDFKQLKTVVMDQNHLEGPAGKLASTLAGGSFHAATYLRKQQFCLEKTLEHLDEETFNAGLQAILTARHIFIHAKSASASMGQLLFFRLRRLGLWVNMIPSGGSEMLEGLAQAEKEDLVILFGFSKISREGRVILGQQSQIGYQTLCFTSRLHLPPEERATFQLYVCRGEEREYHSMTAAAALVDALIVALSEQLGGDGAQHLNRLHQMKKNYGL